MKIIFPSISKVIAPADGMQKDHRMAVLLRIRCLLFGAGFVLFVFFGFFGQVFVFYL